MRVCGRGRELDREIEEEHMEEGKSIKRQHDSTVKRGRRRTKEEEEEEGGRE